MRSAPDVAPPRARKASFDQPCDPRTTIPATFFLARSPSVESDDAEISQDSMYGVQSLDEAVHQATVAASECDTDIPAADNSKLYPNPANDILAYNDKHDQDTIDPIHRKSILKAFNIKPDASSDSLLSRPLTPSNPDDPSSLPSSPKSLSSHSLRPLDDISIIDEQLGQAVVSGEEDNEAQVADSGVQSMPQLVMPSLRMPSRRPFTERGKRICRFKVLVAGASGSGKTSLIKSIVQECEDIVHMDPFPPSHPRLRRSSRAQKGVRSAMSEIYASTKPYPSWWSDLDDSRVLRRKSSDDIVLERNLCFVDTPASNQVEQTDAIIYYMYQQLVRAFTALDYSDVDFQSMLAGNGGSQVDAIIFIISQENLTADVECIRKLSDYTNVIPVIGKSDLMSREQIATIKSLFKKHTQTANVKPFLFRHSSPGEMDAFEFQVPFAVSSAKASDDDIMDASTLMNPDYVQPLVSSELSTLVESLFDRDHLAWMRHSAAKKLVQRKHAPQHMKQLEAQNVPSSPSFSDMTPSNPSLASPGSVSPAPSGHLDYTLARITDHTQREEQLAQFHLVKWVSDLQQNLQTERERYAAVARGERATWLTERLSECVMDGSLVPITQTPGFSGLHIPSSLSSSSTDKEIISGRPGGPEFRITRLSPHDPLGIVWWTDDLKYRGWVLFQIAGGFGVVSGLALALARVWGFPSRGLSDWIGP